MAGIFAECRRVLKRDGIMTLMFTHKATGAWDALASGLMEAGFTITASWPINTEAEGSLHIKDKSAANSTIFLVCRPRPERGCRRRDRVLGRCRATGREGCARARRGASGGGHRGVDLYLSCFGPALEEFAKHWPLKRGTPTGDPSAQAESAGIDVRRSVGSLCGHAGRRARRGAARSEAVASRAAPSREAPGRPGSAHRVVRPRVGCLPRSRSSPTTKRCVSRASSGLTSTPTWSESWPRRRAPTSILWDSARRAAKNALGAADGGRSAIDAVHHVAWRIRQQNLQAGRELVERAGLEASPGFVTAMTAVLEVLPVSSTFTKVKGETGAVAEAASDFDALEHLRRLMFSDRVPEPEQLKIWMEDPLEPPS